MSYRIIILENFGKFPKIKPPILESSKLQAVIILERIENFLEKHPW